MREPGLMWSTTFVITSVTFICLFMCANVLNSWLQYPLGLASVLISLYGIRTGLKGIRRDVREIAKLTRSIWRTVRE